MTNSLIRFRGVTKTFFHKTVLDNLDLDVGKGEFLTIVGESGSGKTTLMNILGGLDSSFEGSAVVGESKLGTMRDHELSRFRSSKIGFVFQDAGLLSSLNVIDNVMLPTLFSSQKDRRVVERAQKLLADVGLHGRERDRIFSLSGGERQRLGFARALVLSPSILLCDELSGNLDSKTSARLLDLLVELRRSRSLTVVAATHDPNVVEAGDRALELVDGKLLEARV